MRLKSLEIKGFKSFAKDTTIYFNEAITGIVGPNGSGKSNVVDAIRWVLGEQKSKELRLDTMSDIIFNGTKKKKAGNRAQVSLTFENTKNILPIDYQMVTISRTLYRSGESEYSINGITCRLKDIRNLFLDTGIGSNSYAIIALGMVDDILSDKDNARRRMFEQAAGISKYKKRKKETLAKLKLAEADLDRVEDLLVEIEGNLKSLEKQANRAKRYYQLKDTIKDLSLTLSAIQYQKYTVSLSEYLRSLEQKKDALSDLNNSILKLEATIEAGKKDHLASEQKLSSQQREINAIVGNIRKLENDISLLDQKTDFANSEASRLERQGKRLEVEQGEINDKLSGVSKTKEGAVLQMATLEQDKTQKDEALKLMVDSYQQKRSSLDDYLSKLQAKERACNEHRTSKVVLENKIEALKKAIHNEQEKLVNLQKDHEDVLVRRSEVLPQIANSKKKIEWLQEDEQKRQEHKEKLELQEEDLVETLNNERRKLDATQNEYNLLKNLVDQMSGYPDSIKFLHKQDEWCDKPLLLSDLVSCPEPFKLALESFLEPYLNHFVVDKPGDAQVAIDKLKDHQKGKAQFLIRQAYAPVKTVKAAYPEHQSLLEIVEVKEGYENLFAYLLQGVYVVNEHFQFESASIPEGITLVGRDGSIIGSATKWIGGSVGLFEGNKIGRKDRLKSLEKKLRKREKSIDSLEEELDEINDKLSEIEEKDIKDQLKKEHAILRQLEEKNLQDEVRHESFEKRKSQILEQQEAQNGELEELSQKLDTVQKQVAILEKELEEEQNSANTYNDQYQEIAASYNLSSKAANDANIEVIKQRNYLESLEKEQSYLHNRLQEIGNRANEVKDEREANDLVLEENKTKRANLEVGLNELLEKRDEFRSVLTDFEKSYYAARNELTETENQVRKLHKQYRDDEASINLVKEKVTEQRFQLSRVTERAKISYDIEEASLKSFELPEDINVTKVEADFDKLQRRLDNYGEINPMAVEAFDEIKIRYDHIASQRDDILEAKDDLLKTIDEIEVTATAKFMDAFVQVRSHFIEVFRSLFTEDDTCDLVLLDESNPLDSAIEIIAKPKGKRPKSISLLSGGEKTLTATALLFALYLLKPAPFCIFDEVDAPLDDANIEKFNRIIQKFSKDSQFVIITHNKLTMAAVDVIYGVYMEEFGVSGVSPVDFRHLQHDGFFHATMN